MITINGIALPVISLISKANGPFYIVKIIKKILNVE